MEEFWKLPQEIQSYIETHELPIQMYSTPVGQEVFEGLKPNSGLVTAIIHNDNGEILFINHSEEGRLWELPSGHIEDNEKPDDAIKREVKEETGYEVESVDPVLAIIWPFKDTVRVQLVFEAFVSEKLYEPDGEADEMEWTRSIPEDVTFGEFGQEIYEYYIENVTFDPAHERSYQNYLKHGVTIIGAAVSLAALKGIQKYRESTDEEDTD